MSGPDIFISYNRNDRTAARHFAECFQKEGFIVWWDAALQSGETFDEVIENELRASKAVVVLWSPRSVASRWVRAEATIADRRRKFAPVIIEPCDLPIVFELTHTADLSEWNGDRSDPAWQSFIQDLTRLVDKGRAAEAAEALAKAEEPVSLPPTSAARPSVAQRFAPKPAEANGHYLAPGKVDDLMSALSSLQSAINKTKDRPRPASVADEDDDEGDRTQILTGASGFDLFGADEFHCLELTVDDKLEKRFVVSPLGLKIGRSAPADVVLADSRVSRTHCMVELADERLRVSDLNSTNGTYVDGERIEGTAFLAVGSLLRVGNIVLKHELRTRADV